jgi:hypothetical protein
MAQRLGRGQDGLGLGRRTHRGGQPTSQVMAGQTVVGKFSGRGVGLELHAVLTANVASLSQ